MLYSVIKLLLFKINIMVCEYYDICIIFDIGYIIDVCFYVMFIYKFLF